MGSKSKSSNKSDQSTRVSETTNINVRDIGFTSKDAVQLAAIITAGSVLRNPPPVSAPASNTPGPQYDPINSGAGGAVQTASTLATQGAPTSKFGKILADNIAIVAAAAGVALVVYTHRK